MSWRTNRLIVAARSIGRSLGINRLLASYINEPGYETRYDSAFCSALRAGDCVWDVGANVGYYTQLFADRVGRQGNVFAFEPSPVNYERLRKRCGHLDNIILYQFGLGKTDCMLSFQQGSDDLGATSRVVEKADEGMKVVIRSGASLINSGEALQPNAIKIDVEGYEVEVLVGLGRYLEDVSLHTIGIEVHFGILQKRGMAQAPRQIEQLLMQHSFTVNWPDSSHIIATRHKQ